MKTSIVQCPDQWELHVVIMSTCHLQLSSASLLFIDNPVGTGYSYVTSDDAYTTNVDEIASDLLAVMKSFLAQLPQFSVSALPVIAV